MPNNDCVLRSDVLKAVQYENWREENRVPSINDVHLTEYQLLAQAINSIPAADMEPKKRWIPVMEGLPENYVEVLVTDGENVGIAALQGFMDDEVVWCNAYGMDYIDDPDDEDYLPITHWMPLPEPPKGEANE